MTKEADLEPGVVYVTSGPIAVGMVDGSSARQLPKGSCLTYMGPRRVDTPGYLKDRLPIFPVFIWEEEGKKHEVYFKSSYHRFLRRQTPCTQVRPGDLKRGDLYVTTGEVKAYLAHVRGFHLVIATHVTLLFVGARDGKFRFLLSKGDYDLVVCLPEEAISQLQKK